MLRFGPDGALLGVLDAAGPADARRPGELNGPNDLLLRDGRLYVTTEGAVNDDGVLTFPGLPSEILVYDLQTGAKEVWAAAAPVGGGPPPSFVGMALDDGGRMYVTDYMSPWVVGLDVGGQVAQRLQIARPPGGYTGAAAWDPRVGLAVVWGDDADPSAGGVWTQRGGPRELGLDRPIGVVVAP